MGNSGTFKRSLLFSALSYLGFETYQVISQAVVVHAAAKGKPQLNIGNYILIITYYVWIDNVTDML